VSENPPGFGLIVVGDEVLVGGRSDAHLGHIKQLLARHGHCLAWYWLLPDDPQTLTNHLRRALDGGLPVFCCGGIGATPDDHTRVCAAAAADLPLVRHPGAATLIEERFGADAYPHRIRMADLPAGCDLIDNPYNGIPGFRVGACHFLPGFPQMAWPMAEAILTERYSDQVLTSQEMAVRVIGVPESRLIPLLERLTLTHPKLKVFSLPHLPQDPADTGYILVGMRGREGLDTGLADLRAGLAKEGIAFLPDMGGSGRARHAPDIHPGNSGST
jgi:molybdopterin-biosynthesis enzyme MoeA-like protein